MRTLSNGHSQFVYAIRLYAAISESVEQSKRNLAITSTKVYYS
jgi:hypothetical protein